jgi:hypothetical protein
MATLTGHVSHYTEEMAAERAARRVKGVHAIAEGIEVRCLGEPHGREPVFDPPAILAERINFDRAVLVQHTEQILHGIGHGSPPVPSDEAAN